MAIQELRELARGIHPAILTEAGLGAAITALAERSPGARRGELRARSPAVAGGRGDRVLRRLRGARECRQVRVARRESSVGADCRGPTLQVEVGDDGVGGADGSRGTGIRGLEDRVAAIGGRLTIDSPAGQGTLVVAEIPIA